MTTPSAEGLPHLPAPDFMLRWDSQRAAYYVSRPNVGDTSVFTADQMRAYGELCRRTASPAEGRMGEDLKEGEYLIASLNDLLKVPVGKRGECLRQMAYALELHDFALGHIPPTGFTMVWRDDGDKSVDMSINGEPALRLEITDNDPPADSPATLGEDDAWKVGMFDRWNAFAQEIGYTGMCAALSSIPELRTLAKKPEGRAVVDLGGTGCLHGTTVEGDVTVRANHTWQVHGCLFRGNTTTPEVGGGRGDGNG